MTVSLPYVGAIATTFLHLFFEWILRRDLDSEPRQAAFDKRLALEILWSSPAIHSSSEPLFWLRDSDDERTAGSQGLGVFNFPIGFIQAPVPQDEPIGFLAPFCLRFSGEIIDAA